MDVDVSSGAHGFSPISWVANAPQRRLILDHRNGIVRLIPYNRLTAYRRAKRGAWAGGGWSRPSYGRWRPPPRAGSARGSARSANIRDREKDRGETLKIANKRRGIQAALRRSAGRRGRSRRARSNPIEYRGSAYRISERTTG